MGCVVVDEGGSGFCVLAVFERYEYSYGDHGGGPAADSGEKKFH